jgi:hypothetical protein
MWPARYGRPQPELDFERLPAEAATLDLAAQKGLTYRTYGEYAVRAASDGTRMDAVPGMGVWWTTLPEFQHAEDARDTDNVREFIREFDEYEKHYDSPDPGKRCPTTS